MTEEKIYFFSNTIKLEGLLNRASGDRAVVISHPHPLFGGSMHNGVVESIARVYHQAGYTTLRFNFRGVGTSEGTYGEGQGEKEDVRAALQYLCGKGKGRIDLAGYSFGAWVNLLTGLTEDEVMRMILVSPPVAFLDFHLISFTPQLKLVIVGSLDQIAPPELIETTLPQWNPSARLEIIEGADHFYGGYTNKLESILTCYLQGEPA